MIINRRYEIIEKLGEGRSQVFIVKDIYYQNQHFAMKIISNQSMPTEIQSFKDEYYKLKSMEHPGIIQPYFNGDIRNIIGDNYYNIEIGDLFYTMEFVVGKNLSEVSYETIIKYFDKIVADISCVLFYLHQSNLIYFDLKPENILFCEEADTKIKFIDFGFLDECNYQPIGNIKGSPKLISPEILSQSSVDFRTDIYSFGILIYWMLFQKYPFDSEDELEIYKLHISGIIDFPSELNYNQKYVSVIDKCTKKNPAERFENTLQLLSEINIPTTENQQMSFVNVYKYISRDSVASKLNEFIVDREKFVAYVKGEKSSGKSRLIENIKRKTNNSVVIDFNSNLNVVELWKRVIVELLLIDSINNETRNSLLNYFENHFNKDEKIDEVIFTIFSKLSAESEFVFLIDNFDLCDEFSHSIIKKLFEILSINKQKSVASLTNIFDAEVSGLPIIEIPPLNEFEVEKFIDQTFYRYYPKSELTELVNRFSNKNNGEINSFIRELLALGIINYTNNRPDIKITSENEALITRRLENYLYDKITLLNSDDLEVIKLISAFDNISDSLISKILCFDSNKTALTLNKLESLNILYSRSKLLSIKFIADSYRNFFYQQVTDFKSFHKNISDKILDNENVNLKEKLFHLEKGGEFEAAINLIMDEIKILQTFSAFSSIVNYLKKIISYPIDNQEKSRFKLQLLEMLIELKNFTEANELLSELVKLEFNSADKNNLAYLTGLVHFGIGNISDALKTFEKILVDNPMDAYRIKIEIANICLDLVEHKKLFAICEELISDSETPLGIVGRAYNLMALAKISESNSYHEAAELIKKSIRIYENMNDKNKIAGAELNLGNILNILGDSKTAFEHWEKSQTLNQSIGNFTSEANALQNLGVYYFNSFECEKALEKYLRAGQIFEAKGDKLGIAITYYNLAESYLFNLEYFSAQQYIGKAISTYESISNEEGKLSSYLLLFIFEKKISNYDKIEKVLGMYNLQDDISSFSAGKKYLNFLNAILLKNEIEPNYIEALMMSILNSDNNYFFYEFVLDLTDFSDANLLHKIVIPFLENEERLRTKVFYKALILYLKGKTAENFAKEYPLPAIKYYMDSYEILKNLSLSELTVKVIYEIAKFFTQSGNYWKGRDFYKYLQSIISYIFQQSNNEQFLSKIESLEYIKPIRRFLATYRKEFLE